MSSPSIAFLLLVIVLHQSAQSPVNDLKSVVVLYRHGDRAPVMAYPTDPYDESYWPFGFGELTNIGKNQHYALGQWIRARYSRFLSRRYSTSSIQVQSSNVNRCLMSAAANLAGLYPPVDDQVWNRSLPWQPIPIHTTPEANDPLLAQGEACPKYTNLYNELMATREFKRIFRESAGLFEYLTEHSGEPIVTLTDAYLLYDTFFIQTLYNLTLPRWAQAVFSEEDGQFYELSKLFWAAFTNTTDLARLKAGPLVDAITSQFESVVSGTGSAPEFLMFSAHDSTVASLLDTLQIFDDLSPPYASTVILELRESRDNYFVNIFYKKFDTIKQLAIPNCGFNCDFNTFRRFVRPVRINLSDWRAECNQEEVRHDIKNYHTKLWF